jgi:Tfp pilus assembly protein PilV
MVAVVIALIAITSIAGLVNTYRYDQDAQDRQRTLHDQQLAGCVRGNELRAQIAADGNSLRAVDLYIAQQLRKAIANPPPGTTQEQIATALDQATHLEGLAAEIKPPAQQDCAHLFP